MSFVARTQGHRVPTTNDKLQKFNTTINLLKQKKMHYKNLGVPGASKIYL